MPKREGTLKLARWGAEGFSHVSLQRQGVFESFLVRASLPMHTSCKAHNVVVLYCLPSLIEGKTQKMPIFNIEK